MLLLNYKCSPSESCLSLLTVPLTLDPRLRTWPAEPQPAGDGHNSNPPTTHCPPLTQTRQQLSRLHRQTTRAEFLSIVRCINNGETWNKVQGKL